MPGELPAKLRLVRCPKCRLLLPEFPHYNVYECGGCGTTLQAKRRQSEAVNSESSSHESEAAPKKSSDLASESNEYSKREHLVFPQEDVENTKPTISSSRECSLDENGKRDPNGNGPWENDLGNKATSSSSRDCSLVENDGRNQNEHGKCNEERRGTFNSSDKDLENEMDADKCSDIRINQHVISNKGCSTELTQCEIEVSSAVIPVEQANDTNLQLSGAENLNNGSLLLEESKEDLNCAWDGEDVNNDKSALVDAKSEVDITGSNSTSKSSSTENFAPEKESISHITTSGNLALSLTEQLKQAHKSIISVDKFDATEVLHPSSELSGTLGELPKSPTTRSSHAYDGSVSSYDGMDDNTNCLADAVSEGKHGRAKGLVNSMIYGASRAQQNSMNFSSDFPCGKHQVNWMRAEREEFLSKMAFHYNGSQFGYESGNPLNQIYDELASDSCEDPDQEKMKLLRMIYKLQDQLNRTSSVNGETNGRLSTGVSCKGKHISAYHGHDLHEGRFRHGLHYPQCYGRCSQGINWRQSHKLSQIPYSSEATSSTHHMDLSCFHCHPQEWACPADLPAHVLCQHEGLCRCYPGHNCCSSHRSYPLCPQWFMDSEPTKTDDQMHQAHEVKKYFREKQNLANRHVRPVSGGAPFVTCHRCFKLLQLPADFLLFKRVCHKLKCGACSEVLKFSLLNRSHIVSYASNAIGDSSSELNDQSKGINGSNQPSASHTNHYHASQAYPVSCSDDYGVSVSKSYSSEGDNVSLTAFHPLHGSECDISVPRGALDLITEKEKTASRHSSSSETPVETNESAGVFSNMIVLEKVSSQMEARPRPKSSPLHQLMGYSSPCQVMRGNVASKSMEKTNLCHGEEF